MKSPKRTRTLQTVEISKSYNGRRVVDNVSVRVEPGEVVGLLGPNGAGKTTSFYIIVGLISPDSGEVLLDDQPVTQLPMYLARAPRSQLPAAGAIGISQAECRRQSDGDFADAAAQWTRTTRADEESDQRSGS